ncbi:hypothetical protein T484DRAFT_1935605 [Baffinella frigidus]|nr:hypothetical protein T484DRAFT_1935605 [Cryptophyta sp. CCMP2293]
MVSDCAGLPRLSRGFPKLEIHPCFFASDLMGEDRDSIRRGMGGCVRNCSRH